MPLASTQKEVFSDFSLFSGNYSKLNIMQKSIGLLVILIILLAGGFYIFNNKKEVSQNVSNLQQNVSEDFGEMAKKPHPLSIESLLVVTGTAAYFPLQLIKRTKTISMILL